jgi:hypothetical protein
MLINDRPQRHVGADLGGHNSLLITGEMRPGIPAWTTVKSTPCSDAGRFSLLHLPPMRLQYHCGADAEWLLQLVAVTDFPPSMPSA